MSQTSSQKGPSLKKWLGAIAVLVLVLVIIGGIKVLQIRAVIAKWAAFKMPPVAVTSMVVKDEKWRDTIDTIGSLVAVNGVTVSADQPGIVKQIAFESGQKVKQGDLLLQLDTNQEQALLRASQAKMQLSATNLRRLQDLLNKRVSSQSDYDQAYGEYLQDKASAEEIQARIDRKTIRAPFDGLLGIRMVNVGQYLQSGDKVAPLQSLDPIYVNFSVPQRDISALNAGGTVKIVVDGLPGQTFDGVINAVNSVVDEDTRNVQVQATLQNGSGKLRPGMYVNVSLQRVTQTDVIVIPASSVSYAPYGDSVFVIDDSKDEDGKPQQTVRQVFVKLGANRGDQVAVLSGLTAGEQIVTSGVFKLHNGASVLINNEIKPANEASPTPADS